MGDNVASGSAGPYYFSTPIEDNVNTEALKSAIWLPVI